MDEILELTKVDFSSIFIAVFVILIGIKAVVTLLEWVIDKMGLETKWMRKKREEHELLVRTSQNLAVLQEQHKSDMHISDKQDEEMKNDIKKLTDMFIEKEINDMRWEINNFATTVSEGRPCNKDSFKHCIHTYEKYEKLLEEQGLENGEIEISMQIVNEAYKKKLKEGF
ncbi:MAG: hypothetical protein K1W19_03260 [Lachnospiraceae bacterium]|jgi:hypothetical protein